MNEVPLQMSVVMHTTKVELGGYDKGLQMCGSQILKYLLSGPLWGRGRADSIFGRK
jgi:hypothetical protein